MEAVLFSINRPHTDNIKAGLKTSELRKRPPKLTGAYKSFIYETLKSGGCGAVIGEFTATNKERWRICVGIPSHLCANACVTAAEIYKYCRGGLDDITEIAVSDLVIYDEPKPLSEFYAENNCNKCLAKGASECNYCIEKGYVHKLRRPPQSWCYVNYIGG